MHGGPSAAEKQAELDKVNAEYQMLDAERQNRIEAPAKAASLIRYAGIAFIVAGALVVYASRG